MTEFFGLVFTDNLILVKVIESVAEMQLEGKLMHHCVGSYHKRTDSLILSATIDGKRIETVYAIPIPNTTTASSAL